jgi:hypothetical protein
MSIEGRIFGKSMIYKAVCKRFPVYMQKVPCTRPALPPSVYAAVNDWLRKTCLDPKMWLSTSLLRSKKIYLKPPRCILVAPRILQNYRDNKVRRGLGCAEWQGTIPACLSCSLIIINFQFVSTL